MRKHIQRKHPEQNIDSTNGYQDKITKLMERSYQNANYIGEIMKTKGLMFIVSFFSCDLKYLKF